MTPLHQLSIQYLKGVGPARKKLFENLGIASVEDLLYLFPRRYEDRRQMTPLDALKPGTFAVTRGVVTAKGGRRVFYNKKHVFELILQDGKTRLFCVWFNQPYLENHFQPGDEVVLYGRVELFNNRLQMVCPEHEIIDQKDPSLSMNRIVPVYPLTRGISQRYLRRLISQCLEQYAPDLMDALPLAIIARQGIKQIAESIRQIHFPDDDAAREEAVRRVSFEEFFLFQVSVILRRMSVARRTGTAHALPPEFHRRFAKGFPFVFTKAQVRAMADVGKDMGGAHPMLRLIQGDVGSGKTVIAFFGCLAAVTNGHQAAVMAPTEIVAQQHYDAFVNASSEGPFGEVRALLLTGSLKKKEHDQAVARIAAGEVDVVFGTHALIQDDVVFKSLSFVVIDEQHKFGVKQRALLSAKAKDPDVLVMTATPIPRSLCLTLYGDLDVSVLDEKPAGRGKIATYHFADAQADGTYARVAEWVAKGTQAYIVYPIIEESEKKEMKAAQVMFDRFCQGEFKKFRLGLIHGRMPRAEMHEVMSKFKAGAIDILVTTTVLEVGIDVPQANVMVIEHADNFGLSQLHQLRGRIGRSDKNAVCILLGDPSTEEGHQRLDAILKTTDGFIIAEKDLEIRGPGQYFGRHQHGLNELRMVNPMTQIDVLEAARKEAVLLVKADATLKNNAPVKALILRRYPEYLQRVLAG